MERVYFGDWSSKVDMEADFMEDAPTEAEILFAVYEYKNYSGNAHVLFKQDEKLFEVNGSHCSCYGLGGQWKPEETSLEALANVYMNSSMWRDGSYQPYSREARLAYGELLLRLKGVTE